MKKLAVYLSFCLIFSLFAGCSPTPKVSSEEPIVITVWHYYNGDIKSQFDDLVARFNETVGKEKNIMVDAYTQGGVNELADAVLASANSDVGSNEMPDIFAAYSDNAYRLDKLGVVASLDDYFTAEELAAYRSEFLTDGRFSDDGTLKIIPTAKSTELLYINKTAFDEFSAATNVQLDSFSTWEGIADAAKKHYEWSGGKAYFGIDSMSNFMVIATKQLGKDIFTVDGDKVNFNLDSETAKKLWDTYYVPFINGYFTTNGRFRSDDVKNGSIVAFTGSNSSASYFPKAIETGKDTNYPIESYVLPYPTFEGKDHYSAQQGAGMVVTKADADTEKACVEFLKWFTAPQQNIQFAAQTSYLPVQNEALNFEKTTAALGSSDPDNIRVQTAKAIYDVLDNTILYASRPFLNSIETRNVLNDNLAAFIEQDLQQMDTRIQNNENRSSVISDFTSHENFEKWYDGLSAQINNLL